MVLLALALFGSLVWSAFRGYGRALDLRQTLEKTHATQADFTPPRDGSIPEDRLRRFLDVRRVLKPWCETAGRHQRAFGRMSRYREEDEPPTREFFADAGRALRSVFSLGRDFGGYVIARNEALLDHEMGLGEYTWIYVVAYFGWLGHSPVRVLPSETRPDVFEARVFPQVAQMIRRHAAEADDPAAWLAELEALAREPGRVPFQEGLPPELEASLMPFRAELERLACPVAGELDVVLTERTRVGYDHR